MDGDSAHRRPMDGLSLLQGIRFIDTFFPSGGYAFSSGLEAAVQDGAVRNADDLSVYVKDLLMNAAATCEAIAVARAQGAGSKDDLSAAVETDGELDAMKIGRGVRLASRQMGRRVIRVACEQTEAKAILRSYLAAVETDQAPGHLAVGLGLTLGTCGWTCEQAVAAYLYQMVIGFVSAAMKLLPIGQREGQRLLEGWLPHIARISRDIRPDSRMAAWAPVQDIYGMRHGRLEWRLFRS